MILSLSENKKKANAVSLSRSRIGASSTSRHPTFGVLSAMIAPSNPREVVLFSGVSDRYCCKNLNSALTSRGGVMQKVRLVA